MGFCVYCKKRDVLNGTSHFFKFPTQNYNEWVKKMGWKDWTPKKSSTLCSDHFTLDCLDLGEYRARLRKGSIPTIFGNSNNIEKTLLPMVHSGMSNAPIPTNPGCSNREKKNATIDVKTLYTKLVYMPPVLPAVKVSPTNQALRNFSVEHDHHYIDTPTMLRKKLNLARTQLGTVKSERKVLKQRVKRFKNTIETMKSVIKELRRQKIVSERGSKCSKSCQTEPSIDLVITNKRKSKPLKNKKKPHQP